MERGIITITENGLVAIPTAPVWMTQQEMSDAFNVFGCDIRKAIHSIYKNMELLESETKRYIKQDNGINYDVYSLEMVIAVSFKLRSRESVAFRRFIMGKLYAANRKNRYICSFRQRHIYEKPQVVDTKDIRPDKVRNTT